MLNLGACEKCKRIFGTRHVIIIPMNKKSICWFSVGFFLERHTFWRIAIPFFLLLLHGRISMYPSIHPRHVRWR